MKKFLLRVLLIICITLIADRIISIPVKLLYKRTTTTDEYKIESVTYKMDAPLIFMGSSRCHHHYIPSVFEDTLKTKVYNAGLWGMKNIYFQYALLNNILERYTPRTICLEIHPIDYLASPFSGIDVVGSLAPYINLSTQCDSLLKKAKIYYKLQLSPLYRYNSEFANLILGNVSTRSEAADKGFKMLTGALDTSIEAIKPEAFPFPPDSNKINCLQSFINKCKEKKIQLIMLYSPMYATEKNNLFNIPDSIAKKNNIVFINHYNLPDITGNAQYYFDYGHLNKDGALRYSSVVASELKEYINMP